MGVMGPYVLGVEHLYLHINLDVAYNFYVISTYLYLEKYAIVTPLNDLCL